MEIILASTSPSRKRALTKLGVQFRCVSPTVSEDALKQNFSDRADHVALASHLAQKKVESVWQRGSVVIGGDQLVSFGGEVFGKPGDFAKTCEQLARFSGATHQLITATSLIDCGGRSHHIIKIAKMSMRKLNSQQIEGYVKLDQPWDCAGAYRFESSGGLLFEKVECDDPSQIEGMPLLATMDLLNAAGWNLPQFLVENKSK